VKFIFLVEEKSMQKFLEVFLEKRLPTGTTFKVIPHEGKSDLKKSIPIKLKALNKDDVMFIVLIDQDSSDCRTLKLEINDLCCKTNANYKVCIACRELEAWYLGDLSAIDKAFASKLSKQANKKKFRNPDMLNNAKQELKKHIGEIAQIAIAEKVATAMSESNYRENKSHSFHYFLKTIGLDSTPIHENS